MTRTPDPRIPKAESIARRWSCDEIGAVEFVETLLEEHRLPESIIVAKALELSLYQLEKIDKMIAAFECRRDAALREIDKRQNLLAKRARDLTERLATEAEIIELEAAE